MRRCSDCAVSVVCVASGAPLTRVDDAGPHGLAVLVENVAGKRFDGHIACTHAFKLDQGPTNVFQWFAVLMLKALACTVRLTCCVCTFVCKLFQGPIIAEVAYL